MFVDTALGEYARNLVNLKGQEDKVFRLVLDNDRLKELIIELNTDHQLYVDGVDSTGKALFNNFTQRSVDSKGEKYDAYETGEFYSTVTVTIRGDEIIIDADPIKDPIAPGMSSTNLFEMYTPDILGLTDENKQVLIDEALNEFRRWYRENL